MFLNNPLQLQRRGKLPELLLKLLFFQILGVKFSQPHFSSSTLAQQLQQKKHLTVVENNRDKSLLSLTKKNDKKESYLKKQRMFKLFVQNPRGQRGLLAAFFCMGGRRIIWAGL